MKKVLALILTCVMMMSMAACSNTGWTTKNVQMPNVKLEMQENEQYNVVADIRIKDSLIISPLKDDAFNPEAAAEAIKKLNFTKGWEVTNRYAETGAPYFMENGQMMAYQYGTNFTFYTVNSTTGAIDQYFTVYYSNDTDEVIGYATVAVEFMYGQNSTNLTQKQMFEVLKIVYGEEYAKYLCYGKMDEKDGRATSSFANGDACISFERTIEEDLGVAFAVNIYNTNKDSVKGYGGDFTPTMGHLSLVGELLRWNAGDSILDLKNMGTTFLAKHYGENAYFTVEGINPNGTYRAYLYSEENGYKTTLLRYDIAQKDDNGQNRKACVINMSSFEDVEEIYAQFQIGTLKGDASDEAREEMKQRALNMVKDILNVEDVENPFAEDKHFTMMLGEKEIVIKFVLNQSKDDTGNETTTLTFATSTNLKVFDEIEKPTE